MMLELSDVSRRFGGVQALRDVSLSVSDGEVFGLIGPNGAGKTTLVNVLTGYVVPDRGVVRLAGADLAARTPHDIAAAGVARTFQNVRLYRGLTALQNVEIGMHMHRPYDTFGRLVFLPSVRRQTEERRDRCAELLSLVGLDPASIGDRDAGTLSYGDQRRVEIARALALQPRVLVLDEPAAGMTPPEKARLGELVGSLPSTRGVTVFLIEHDLRLVHQLCERVAVLNFGQKIAEGTPADVVRHQAVVSAYLGAAAGSEKEMADALAAPEAPSSPAAPTPRPARTGTPVLTVADLRVSYGAVQAVSGVSFEVHPGELVTLIGANGAGKSSILRALSGLVPARGTARFGDVDLLRSPSAAIVRAGLIHVPEGREVLTRLTVEENLALGTWARRDGRQAARDIEEQLERFPLLAERRRLPAGQLSGGEQQMLAVARALVGRPRLLLLDEPSLGLAPRLTDEVLALVRNINTDGTTVVLVEQNAFNALEIADRGYVIETGRVALSGTAAELRSNPEVRRSYLGA